MHDFSRCISPPDTQTSLDARERSSRRLPRSHSRSLPSLTCETWCTHRKPVWKSTTTPWKWYLSSTEIRSRCVLRFVCVCVCLCACMCMNMGECECMHASLKMFVCVCACVCTYNMNDMYMHMIHIYKYTCTCKCVCEWLCIINICNTTICSKRSIRTSCVIIAICPAKTAHVFTSVAD